MKRHFDLHVHSNASDGSLSPRDLVRKARQEQVQVIALTDHDTTDGVEETISAGEQFGVTVVPGVEISIDYSPETMHLCGYFIDVKNEELKKGLAFVQDARLSRNPQILERLNAMGIDITIAEVDCIAQGGQVGRPHMAEVMVRKGYVNNTKEAFTKYLAKGTPCYVDKARLDLGRAVAMIRSAGGIAVLAHPGELRLDGEQAYQDLFRYIEREGVEGVESYSSHHSNEQNTAFKQLADRFGLFTTGGSDFHGDTKPNVQLGVFGEQVEIDVKILLKTMNRISSERKKL
jgi:predicted metal-dependent phosphoesterase TrpH